MDASRREATRSGSTTSGRDRSPPRQDPAHRRRRCRRGAPLALKSSRRSACRCARARGGRCHCRRRPTRAGESSSGRCRRRRGALPVPSARQRRCSSARSSGSRSPARARQLLRDRRLRHARRRRIKSRVAAELAVSLAKSQHPRVLLLEGNRNRPAVHRLMRVDFAAEGLSRQLESRARRQRRALDRQALQRDPRRAGARA